MNRIKMNRINDVDGFFDIDLNIIEYCIENDNTITQLKNHKDFEIFNFFIQKIQSKELSIDDDLYSFISSDKNKFKTILNDTESSIKKTLNDYKTLYLSISSDQIINSINPIRLYRFKYNNTNILCLVEGLKRFFILKALGIKKVKVFIENEDISKYTIA